MISRVTNHIPKAAGVQRCRLRVVLGPDAGHEVEIPQAGVVVGAASPSDVVLTDASVSSRHCVVKPVADGFEISDLKSKNGTSIDGTLIEKATVSAGTIVRIGNSLLQLLPEEEVLEIPPSKESSFGAMVGGSLAMRQLYAVLARASRTNASILIGGESGTGKELCARAIHDNSPRAKHEFVTFDCGAVSENLIESDLFGHVRGAFTGALADRPGAFEMANGGTLFLDEIGDLPLKLQPKLLRMLETGEATPLGGKKSQKFDVRIVAATHRDLGEEVAKGTFRGDLFYRLAVVEVKLPALRNRLEDLPGLVSHFLKREGASDKVKECTNLNRLRGYGWPGNVRELRNVIARCVALSLPNTPFEEMLLLLGAPSKQAAVPTDFAARPYHEAKADLLSRFDNDYVKDLLSRTDGNLSEAARVAGIERRHLYRMLARIGVKPPAEKKRAKE